MMKASALKALAIKINILFLAFIILIYISIILQPPYPFDDKSASPFSQCHNSGVCDVDKMGGGRVEDQIKLPSFQSVFKDKRIGLVNAGDSEMIKWNSMGKMISVIKFDKVSEKLEWKELFPEWIDEEEQNETPECPKIPMPDFGVYDELDVVVASVPCRRPEIGWSRDMQRLQVHLVAANLALRRAVRDKRGRVKMVFVSACMPMTEVFKCDDLVKREGEWWLYEVEVERLGEKMALPVGSCKLALPLWQEGTNKAPANFLRREAYATVLHSSDIYVCGAITLAQSLINTGTNRDLLLLHDHSIPPPKLRALATAGWTLVPIGRIRNPFAAKNSYNEYNYSKLRLWQLTNYDKLIFLDSDILVLRNLDLLFRFPELSAAGNDGYIFNSGVMVIEPSNCTFNRFMKQIKEVVSYNGGDQGFLNEAFPWWHRLPRKVNFLKNFWSNTTEEMTEKNRLFKAEPPELYVIHYLGLKPWLCYRDYDCNWNVGDQRVYASDPAHRRWWKVYDGMKSELQKFCGLSKRRNWELRKEMKKARESGFGDGHWRLRILDTRVNEI
ncbi:Glucuronosyltransferase protein [Dioscorea alata]|uniref:Glucuronosyltransferase protein n=1 Tax=Dioscorea alata TaxID=55571 RepID=A0ACB7VXI2_DIOAL|nr:Glucuronosyltransferase protein [Dioscorea alata]